MAEVTYTKNSLYARTKFYGNYLDVAEFPNMPKNVDDVLFEINKTYQNRPDLLAFDLNGDSSLWWVFALRNPNTIKDPVFDMKAGRKIYLPKKSTLDTLLG